MDKQAFDNINGKIFNLSKEEIAKGLKASRESSRQRMILPLHRKQSAPVQRMINFLQPETYIRPHLHPRKGASETIIVITGSITFYVFDDQGEITAHYKLTSVPGENMIDMEPNVWHSFVVNEPDTIIYEFKMGPYDKELDKTFAVWSPEENSSAAKPFLNRLKSGQV